MKFNDWTAKAVEDRILEMAETLRRMPAAKGPKAYGSAMPEVVRRMEEAYGSSSARYRHAASAGALGRMEAVFGWINALSSEADRKLIYAWSWVKVRKGMTIGAFAEENLLNERTLRRAITAICQGIADHLNQKGHFRLVGPDLHLSEIQPDITSTTVSSDSRDHGPAHWSASDAKPQIDPALARRRVIEPRQVRAR